MALSQDAIIVTLLDGVIASWSRGAERVFGFSAAEMQGRSLAALIPNDRSAELGAMLDQIRAGASIDEWATVRCTKDGRLLDVIVNMVPIRDGAGQVVSGLIVTRDLTAQRRVEQSLRESEGRWAAVIASAVDAMIVIDAKGAIEVFNPAAERLFGYPAGEVIGRSVNLLMPSPYREEHDHYMADYLHTGHKKIIGIGREVTGRRRDGSTFPVHLSVGEMAVGNERHFTGILHDLTPRVELEARIREQTALARLGEMAAVIAHEVKNPLAAVRGAVQVVGRRLPADSKDGPIIAEIVTRIDALDGLIQDLLLFARTPQPRISQVDLAALLRLVVELLGSDPAHSSLRIDLSGALPPISGDAELLKIVFQNLLINAGQAMQGRGTVAVTLSADGGWQRVLVSDSGPGLTAEAREHLFQPFFTTKSRGTGLGLPTAKRLVELHGGAIAVDSRPGAGTSVIVTLPAMPPATSRRRDARA